MLGGQTPRGVADTWGTPAHGLRGQSWERLWRFPQPPASRGSRLEGWVGQMDESQFPQVLSLLVGGDDIPAVGRGPGARSQPPSLPACSSRRKQCWLGLLDPSDQRELLDHCPLPRWLRGPCLPGSSQVCLRAGRAGGLQISVPTQEGEPHSTSGD